MNPSEETRLLFLTIYIITGAVMIFISFLVLRYIVYKKPKRKRMHVLENVMPDKEKYLPRPIASYPTRELIALDFQTTDDRNQFLDLLLEKYPEFNYALPGEASVIFPKGRVDELKGMSTDAGLHFSEAQVVSPGELSLEEYEKFQQQKVNRGKSRMSREEKKGVIIELRENGI